MAGGSEGSLQGKDNQKDFGREDSIGGGSYATGEDNLIRRGIMLISAAGEDLDNLILPICGDSQLPINSSEN